MKQTISPVAMVVAIVVVVALIAFIGFKVFGPPEGGDDAVARNKYMRRGGGPSIQDAPNSNRPPPGAASPGPRMGMGPSAGMMAHPADSNNPPPGARTPGQ